MKPVHRRNKRLLPKNIKQLFIDPSLGFGTTLLVGSSNNMISLSLGEDQLLWSDREYLQEVWRRDNWILHRNIASLP
jgi:hypothetical protein